MSATFDNYTWHAAPQQYLEAAIAGAGVFPVLVPSFGDRLDLDQLLDSVDGVMVTGSKSNVHPSLYGGEATEANGPYDPARDATTLPLIRRAIERGVPLLAICRGIQELNVALGGTLATEIQEREGSLDHRAPVSDNQDERFAIRQPVSIKPGSCLAGVFGAGDIMVNSVHRQGVDRLGDAPAGRGGGRGRHGRGGVGEGRARLRRRRAVASGILGADGQQFGEIFRAFGDAARAPRACARIGVTHRRRRIGLLAPFGFTSARFRHRRQRAALREPEIRLSTTRSAMALRVCTEAEPTCGSSVALGRSSSACGTCGSSANTSRPAAQDGAVARAPRPAPPRRPCCRGRY